MKCMYCQGEMARGHAPFYIDRNDVHVSFNKVPAWVCSQCGEAYFEETAVDALQDVIKAVDEQSGKLAHTS